MARGGKLTKLKSVIKRWQSAGNKISRTNGNSSSTSNSSLENDAYVSDDKIPGGYHPVYVGRSRRRYLISSDVIVHPLVQELVDRSGNDSDEITVGCEVVLFEHLLWMIENADPLPESSLDELAEYYVC
ncbi:hypothetical protein GIB67_040792 [Kingdonia uniflora]|uniref:Uncharacterized protein n=1 Tax=Kingdonia uniflora TaxID=39325 RepID=A0A7J7P4C7_9MAGN|nr:hypothetical protein GIB67_040792 [Kingdonia uniflora]